MEEPNENTSISAEDDSLPDSLLVKAQDSDTIVSSLDENNKESRRISNTSTLTMTVSSDGFSDSNSSGVAKRADLYFSKRSSDLLSDSGAKAALPPAAFHETRRRSIQALPISRLKFLSLGLVGRDEEVEMLETCLKRVAPSEGIGGSRELVLISGNSGTGKTALAFSLVKSIERLGGLYVKGKFDLYLRDEPFSASSAACRQICGRILFERGNESFDKIRSELLDTLGIDNLCLLIKIIPELSEIFGDDIIMDDGILSNEQAGEESKARFNYALRIFIRAVASHFAPLVILLDDIQWADNATLDLLQVLIADRQNPSIMLIGAYRENEVDVSHPLSSVIGNLKEYSNDFNLTEINVTNLDVFQVNEVVMRLLSIDEPTKTQGLADVCFKRTLGNAFSLVVFLEMLQTEELLHFSLGAFKWEWDEKVILSETAATSNVVDLMMQQIQKLPPSVGKRLSIAACLGFSFETDILISVWGAVACQLPSCVDSGEDTLTSDVSKDEDDLSSWLTLVEEEGILEAETNGSRYRWVHDKVQEAAISIIPHKELPILKAKIGKILVEKLGESEMDTYIFTIVNLLHDGTFPEDESERIRLAKLSLQASEKAKGQSAFEIAGKYANIGIEALPEQMWTDHYELTLYL